MNRKPIITPVYKEALLEVENLKSLAEQDAKKAILEAMTPIVKKEIDKTINSANRSFLFEEEDITQQALNAPLPPGQPDASPPPPATLPAPTDAPVPEAPAGPPAEVPPALPAAPVTPAPIQTSVSGLEIPLDKFGANGVTFNLPALYAQTGGNAAAIETAFDQMAGSGPDMTAPPPPVDTGVEAPMPPEGAPVEVGQAPDGVSYDTFKENINVLKTKIMSGESTPFLKKLYETSLMELFSQLQTIRVNGLVTEKIGKLQEAKLEQLYNRLKESGKDANTYQKTTIKEQKMKTLKEFAKALFEGEQPLAAGGPVTAKGTTGFDQKAKVGTDVGHDDKKVDSSAEKNSESRPVSDPGRKDNDGKVEDLKEAAVLEAELAEIMGCEKDKEEVKAEASTANPGKAKNLGDTVGKTNPNPELAIIEMKNEEIKAEALKKQNESLSKKLNALKEEQSRLAKMLREAGMGMVEDGEIAADTVDVTIKADTVNINVDETGLTGDSAGSALDSMGPEDEIVISDDEEESEPEVDEDELKKENDALKEHINQMELLTARSLYLNKFLSREDLSRTQKRKIVEYLDSARTLAEAKTIYGRIKKIIEEAKGTTLIESKKPSVSSSSSSVSKPGSAVISESVQNPYAPTRDRFMALAGIKQNSN